MSQTSPRHASSCRAISGCGSRGFTLAEVLVALAVLAIGMSAALTAAGQVGRIAGDLKQRTVAHWVAQNEITRMRLQTEPASNGRQQGDVAMGGADWHWEMNLIDTPVGGLKRLSIEVSLADRPDAIIISEVGFIGRVRPGFAESPWEVGNQDQDGGESEGEGG
jgi:general secretion pathway protein I